MVVVFRQATRRRVKTASNHSYQIGRLWIAYDCGPLLEHWERIFVLFPGST